MTHVAQRFSRATNSIAAMVFFAPEVTEQYQALGLNWFEGYFCSRSAAFGRSAPEVVESTFYNFFPGHVRRAVEGGWAKVSAEVLTETRFVGAGKALRRLIANEDGSLPEIARANELLWKIVDNSPHQGRPLYAAHLSEPRRDDPFESLWQGANLMREFRGDGHIAVLVAHDIGPVEALILHAPMLGMPREGLMRGPREWPEADVAAAFKRLAERGLVDGESLTEAGTALRAQIEEQTDVVSDAPFRALPSDAEEAIGLLRPLAELVEQRQRR